MAPRVKYDTKQLENAIAAVNGGMPRAKAAKAFNIPKATLYGKLSGKSPIIKKMGPVPYLGDEGEKLIVEWIVNQLKRGYSPRRMEIINSAQMFIEKCNIVTPFKNNRPSKDWFMSFLKRHPELSLPAPSKKKLPSNCVSEIAIREWFCNLENEIRNANIMDVFEDPSRTYSIDEITFQLCLKSREVVGFKGFKNMYKVVPGPEKSDLTFMACFNARGDIVNPGIVYPYLQIPSDILSSVPDNWFIGRSTNGWIKSETFCEYLTKGFIPWLNENDIKRPVILFIDGNKSHTSVMATQLCEENNILLYLLPNGSANILQPIENGVFKSFKELWRKEVKDSENIGSKKGVRQKFVAPLLVKILNKVEKSSVNEGFCETGLYPFNPYKPDYSKCVKLIKNEPMESSRQKIFVDYEKKKIAADVFRKILGDEAIKKIENREKVDLNILYHLWDAVSNFEMKVGNASLTLPKTEVLSEENESFDTEMLNEENESFDTEMLNEENEHEVLSDVNIKTETINEENLARLSSLRNKNVKFKAVISNLGNLSYPTNINEVASPIQVLVASKNFSAQNISSSSLSKNKNIRYQAVISSQENLVSPINMNEVASPIRVVANKVLSEKMNLASSSLLNNECTSNQTGILKQENLTSLSNMNELASSLKIFVSSKVVNEENLASSSLSKNEGIRRKAGVLQQKNLTSTFHLNKDKSVIKIVVATHADIDRQTNNSKFISAVIK